MKRLLIVSMALVSLVSSTVGLSSAETETFTGVASASGTFKRPQLLVNGNRYELKASDKADAGMADLLAKFSKGDRGTYVVEGTPGTVNGGDGTSAHGTTDSALYSAFGGAFSRSAVQPRAVDETDGSTLGPSRLTLPEGMSSLLFLGGHPNLVYGLITFSSTEVMPQTGKTRKFSLARLTGDPRPETEGSHSMMVGHLRIGILLGLGVDSSHGAG